MAQRQMEAESGYTEIRLTVVDRQRTFIVKNKIIRVHHKKVHLCNYKLNKQYYI